MSNGPTVGGALGGSNPEYVNARVRARRAALFDEEEYRKLVRMGPSAIARYMEETEYEREINELGTRYSGVDLIEYALHKNMARHFHEILDWSEGRLYELLAAYLRKYDEWNVKTIIRGIYSEIPAEEIETDLIRAGEFDDAFLERLASAETIEDAVELLDGTIFGPATAEAYEEYERSGTLVPLENAIDRTFYESLLADVPSPRPEPDTPVGQYIEVLEAEIDFRNVINALRLARSGANVDPSEYFIEGGTLFSATELSGLVADQDALVERISASSYGRRLEGALTDLAEAESLIAFEHALDAALLQYSDRLSYLYPTSVASVLSYILAKEREVENVRAIARAKEVDMPEEEIERELVIT
jgi:V/A-type H+/Na+-transporting ATPase subunit C